MGQVLTITREPAFSESFDFGRYAHTRVTTSGSLVVDHQPHCSPLTIAWACWVMGWRVLWLYWRFWVAALWLDIRTGMTRTARSLTTAYLLAGAGWGFGLGATLSLLWR